MPLNLSVGSDERWTLKVFNDVALNKPNSARNSGLVTRKSEHETKNQKSRLLPVIRSDRCITLAYGHRRSSNPQTGTLSTSRTLPYAYFNTYITVLKRRPHAM